MATLRLSLIVVVLLNLLVLAANAGWLGETTSRGEPERLSNQLHPERIMLLGDIQSYLAQHSPAMAEGEPPPKLASEKLDTALTPTPTCIAFTDVSEDIALAIEDMEQDDNELSITKEQLSPAEDWWVRVEPSPDRQTAERRADQLSEKGVRDLYIIRAPGPDLNAISLGLFRTQERAERHLSDLHSLGVEGALVRPRIPARYDVRLTGPETKLDAVAKRIRLIEPDTNVKTCQS